jgi:hypothetical protein
MADTNFVVSRLVRVERAETVAADDKLRAGGVESIVLDDGRRVRLDPDNPRSPGFARILLQLAELGRPVYLELDSAGEAVARIELPEVGHVRSVREVADGLEVQLDSTHGRYLLARDDSGFAEMARTLREAADGKTPVILTPGERQKILDIRFFRQGPDDGPLPDYLRPDLRRRDSLGDLIARLLRWPLWPWRWWYHRCISPAYAQQVFDAMSATSCDPAGIAPPCIPFMYPRDGCWGRAHEMRRLMVDMGLWPGKIWIEGSLNTPTRNYIACFVNWGWHVAPTLCVRRRRFWPWWWWPWWTGERMVFDPSLFTTPVTPAQWKAVQGDANATLTYTEGARFWLWPYGYWPQTDPGYVHTATVLATYRTALQNQVNQDGPPPYANCP